MLAKKPKTFILILDTFREIYSARKKDHSVTVRTHIIVVVALPEMAFTPISLIRAGPLPWKRLAWFLWDHRN